MDIQNAKTIGELNKIEQNLRASGQLNRLALINIQLKKVQLALKDKKRKRQEENDGQLENGQPVRKKFHQGNGGVGKIIASRQYQRARDEDNKVKLSPEDDRRERDRLFEERKKRNTSDEDDDNVGADDGSNDGYGSDGPLQEEMRFDQSRLYIVTSTRRIEATKFGTSGTDLHIRVKPTLYTDNFLQVLKNIYLLFEQLIKDFLSPLPSNSYARLVIITDDLDVPISLRFQKIKYITPEAIFTHIKNVVQSRKQFSLHGNLRINIVHTTLVEGNGPKHKFLNVKNRKSVTPICNGDHDNLCMANSICLGMAYADGEDKKILKSLARCPLKLQQRSVKLHKMSKVSLEDRPYNLKDLEKFQKFLKGRYQIGVIQGYNLEEFVYLGPLADKKITLFCSDNHYDCIKEIDRFMPRNKKMCYGCSRVYHSTWPHLKCLGLCNLCNGANCDGHTMIEEKRTNWKKCRECNRNFPTTKCFENHKKNHGVGIVCNKLKKCPFCLLNVKSANLTPPSKHRCGKTMCQVCKQVYELHGEHLCYVQKYKEDNEDTHIPRPVYYFDLETRHRKDNQLVPTFVCFECERGNLLNVYRGDQCVEEFCTEILKDNRYKNSIFLAHNGAKFDNYFVVKFIQQQGYMLDLVHNGGSVMFFTIRSLNITFKDTYMFLPKKLSDLPKMFGMEESVRKGYFPYLFPYPGKGVNYVGKYPDLLYFNIDQMKEGARENLVKWWEERVEGGHEFNYHVELEKYCSNDVSVLRMCCEEFRKMFLELGGVDPFVESFTLTHACSLVFRKNYLKENTIAVIPPWGYRQAKKYSNMGIVWGEYMGDKLGRHVHHARNGGEKKVCGKYYVDGFIPPNEQEKYCGIKGTVLEMNGCTSHGCPHCFQRTTVEPLSKKTMGELYEKHVAKINDLLSKGYVCKELWEHEYNLMMKNDRDLKRISSRIKIRSPLQPRDAFHGGRTEVFRLFVESGDEEIVRQLDFKSLYPHVQRHPQNYYPVGHPKIILSPPVCNIDTYFGLIKAKILPPQYLDIPVLSYVVENNPKLMFPLCRMCAETRSEVCQHSEEERAWEGTFVTPELQLALQNGYKVLEIYEVWHWEKHERSNTLFRDYMGNFLKIKIAASGFPEGCDTDEKRLEYVEYISEKENIDLKVEDVVANKGLKAIGKAIITSLWGKMAQRLDKEKTVYVKNAKDYYDMILDDRYNITTLNIITEEMLEVGYKIPEELRDPHPYVNHVLAAFVTSYGRIHLYKQMCKIKIENLLYCDTDCIVFKTGKGLTNLETGVALGELSCEIYGNHNVSDSIGLWVALAPKTYGYRLKIHDNISMVKCKGITLNFTTTKIVNIESMIRLLKIDTNKAISVRIDHQMERHKAKKTISYTTLEKEFSFTFDKRVILDTSSYITLPYGHRDIPTKIGQDGETSTWREKVEENKRRRETKKELNIYQNKVRWCFK